MSRIIKCLAIDGPCQGRNWESYSHDVNVKLRARGGHEHQYRMSGAYPDATKPVEYFYNDPRHVKPSETAAEPRAAQNERTVTDLAPVPDREAGSVTNNGPAMVPDRMVTDHGDDIAPLGTKLNPL